MEIIFKRQFLPHRFGLDFDWAIEMQGSTLVITIPLKLQLIFRAAEDKRRHRMILLPQCLSM